MPIRKDRSATPQPPDGLVPDQDPVFARNIMAAWYEQYLAAGFDDKAMSIEGRAFRASWAGQCTRNLAWNITGVEYSDPPTVAESYNMWLGQIMHQHLQTAAEQAYPDAECEVAIDLRDAGVDGAASADIVVSYPDGTTTKIVVEIKTINGFGFKMAATSFKGGYQGPRLNAIRQGAMAAKAKDADELVILLFARELVGKNLVGYLDELDRDLGRFVAQWTFSRDEYTEHADIEINKVRRVLEALDAKDPGDVRPLVETDDHGVVEITDPATGAWVQKDAAGNTVDAGKTWQCGYCWQQKRCLAQFAGTPMPVTLRTKES